AHVPCRPALPRLLDQTRSPGENPLPAPAEVTVPTRSRPVTNGNGISVGQRPERMSVSIGLITATSTATSTSVGPGTGTGSSPTPTTSAGPGLPKKAARIVALLAVSSAVDISFLLGAAELSALWMAGSSQQYDDITRRNVRRRRASLTP